MMRKKETTINYQIRELKSAEYSLLEDFLYEAIFQRDEANLVSRSIIEKPELAVYIEDFGSKKDDICFCAEVNQKVVGAVWVRNIEGYGNVAKDTPEIAISLYKEYRGYGIGTELMKQILKYLKDNHYKKVSLAVQKDNYALKMYLAVGFEIIDETEEEYIMIQRLN